MTDFKERLSSLTPSQRAAFEALLLKKKAAGATNNSDRIVPSQDGSPIPLSFAQKRLWYLYRLDPGSSAYNLFGSQRMQGDLDVAALEKSIFEIIKRHESLRTTFHLQNGMPVQIIHDINSYTIDQIDLKNESRSHQPEMLKDVVEHVFRWPFDLSEWPLFHIALVRTSERDHTAIMSIHHIISDAWSMGILVKEMNQLYAACTKGETLQLPPLVVQYKDFARWQERWLQTPQFQQQLGYWQQKLGGELAHLCLPTDFARPQFQTTSGAFVEKVLELDTVERIRCLAQEQQVSVYMFLLAVFTLLLHRLSRQDDIVIGSPIAGRHRPEIENLIGFFINTIVMRTDISASASFLDLLKQVRKTVLDAFSNQDLPFEKIVEVLSPERDLSRTPIFQIFFNHINVTTPDHNQGNLPAAGLEAYHYQSKFDLTLYVFEEEKQIRLTLVYNDNLFRRQRMLEIMEQYSALVEQILTRPDLALKSYTLVSESAAKILPSPGQPLAVRWEGHILDRIGQYARQTQDKTAIEDSTGTITYLALDRHIRFLSQQFNRGGVTSGERVAIIGNRGIPWACKVLSVMHAGGVFCILDPNYPPQRLAQYISEIKPRFLVPLQSNDNAIAEIVQQLQALGSLDEITLLNFIAEPKKAADPIPSSEDRQHPDDLAYISFTSGTTSVPKAIGGSMRPISHFLSWYEKAFEIDSTDRFSLLSGLSHDPVLRDLFVPLWLGATLCIPAPQHVLNPERLFQWMQASHITVTHLTPAMGMLLSLFPNSARQTDRTLLQDLRYVFFGGDLLMPDHVRSIRQIAPKAAIVNFYGATETPQAMGVYRVPTLTGVEDRNAITGPIPLGHGIGEVQLLVINDAGNLAGVGEPGEIWIRTPYLSKGYINDSETTREKFVANPFVVEHVDTIYRTGDLGRYLEDGNVEFIGRADRQVKINGFRIEPGTVEHCLRQHPAIADASVMVKVYDSGVKHLVAFIQALGGNNPESPAVQQFIAERLPSYMVPARVICLAALPLTTNLKINYKLLNETMNGAYQKVVPTEPATTMERCIADVWKAVLNIDSVSSTDNFFEIGGHSLLSIEVIAILEKRTGVSLNPREFVYQTLGQLAAILEKRKVAPPELPPKGRFGFLRKLKEKWAFDN